MNEMHPFATLVAIAERSQQHAQELPTKENTQTHWVGLGMRLLDMQFVVPMGEIAELMRLPHATRLSGVKPFVPGVANVRGRLMALLDLAIFFGGNIPRSRARRRVLAVEDEEQYFGFIIDESLGMQHFPSEAYEDRVEVAERYKPFVRGGYRTGEIVWPVISLKALSADRELEKLDA
ncbi:MAG: chemotaxis protein CheW [Pseudomonadales bacterium]|nr:chemotaxis protein CheW [Pseudomonadales bacterium]